MTSLLQTTTTATPYQTLHLSLRQPPAQPAYHFPQRAQGTLVLMPLSPAHRRRHSCPAPLNPQVAVALLPLEEEHSGRWT